jgi:hypothetical protein
VLITELYCDLITVICEHNNIMQVQNNRLLQKTVQAKPIALLITCLPVETINRYLFVGAGYFTGT